MKKLIAISVMLVLIVGAVFADPSIGGQVKVGNNLAESSNIEGADTGAGGRQIGKGVDGVLKVGFGDDTIGGKAWFYSDADNIWFQDAAAWVWWKPIDQIRFQLGWNPDGDWGADQITGWGFLGEAQDFVAADCDSSFGLEAKGFKFMRRIGAFYGGCNSRQALLVSIYPIENLTINVGIPFDDTAEPKMGNVYYKTDLNVVYNIEGTGALRLSFDGQGATTNKDGDRVMASPKLYASFFLNAIENIGIDVGVGFQPAYYQGADDADPTDPDYDPDDPAHYDGDYTPPISLGVGFTYGADAFGVKLRVGVETAGKKKVAGTEVKLPTYIAAGVLPYYNFTDSTTGFLSVSLSYAKPDSGDAVTGWIVNPYIQHSAGGAKLFAGVWFGSSGVKGEDAANPDKKVIYWGIPIGINFYF